MLLQNKRIFLIEDNLENRVIMKIMLEMHGAVTAYERWGTSTLSRLRAFAPVDLILLDLMFPFGVTGYDIFNEIRAQPDFAGVPIVAVSASDESEAIPRTQAQGFAGFISKPIHDEQFPLQIAAALEHRPVWGNQAIEGN
jgi:two-component system cell cycle response regulator DivK